MGSFGLHPETELRLEDLDDDKLVREIVNARRSERFDVANKALGILIYRRADDVLARDLSKVPGKDAKDVAQESMLSALKASFDGSSMGQFVNLLHKITDRRIADYFKKKENKPDLEPLPDEHGGDEEVWGDTPSESDQTGEVAVRLLVEGVLADMSKTHELVVVLYLRGYQAAGIVSKVNQEHGEQLKTPMTEHNVNKIVSRFRKELRKRLLGENGVG